MIACTVDSRYVYSGTPTPQQRTLLKVPISNTLETLDTPLLCATDTYRSPNAH